MKKLNFKDFMKKHNLKNNSMNEFELQRAYSYAIYTRDCKNFSDEGFVKTLITEAWEVLIGFAL